MHAVIRMQALDFRRRPVSPIRLVGTQPRDAQPHRVTLSLETKALNALPRYVRVWADDRSGVFPVEGIEESALRKLDSLCLTQELTVLPRAA